MSKEIASLQPQEVWKHFYTLTQVPRPSKHEANITETLRKFGENLKLETLVDNVGNVIIRKPATPGYEHREGIILQGHLDMVPQKNSDSTHDFTKDPIDAYVDGEVVRARGTTLGADNGMGVAAAMAVLESKSLEHGPIEALFTVDEETGMTGANELQPGLLKGKILLNLDSETEGELYMGCAGGLDATLSIPVQYEDIPSDRVPCRLTVKGLLGGHSGMDIALGRANSIKLMMRLLNALEDCDARLVKLEGGSLRNAIPREAFATLAVPQGKVDDFIRGVQEHQQIYSQEFALTEKQVIVECVKVECASQCKPCRMCTQEATRRVVRTLFVTPNGVIRMSRALEGLVETSTNLAVVRLEGDAVKGQCLLRSSVESAKNALGEKFTALYSLAGGSVVLDNGYPGWQPKMDSPILHVARETYKQRWGVEPTVMAIHAGLECGIIGGVYPGLDMLSFGPTIMSPHSPDERVNIASVAKFWEFLQLVLKNAPVR